MNFTIGTRMVAVIAHARYCPRTILMDPVVGARCNHCGARVEKVNTLPDYAVIDPHLVPRERSGRTQQLRESHMFGKKRKPGQGRKKQHVP